MAVYASLGSVSSGTLRPDDLLTLFLSELSILTEELSLNPKENELEVTKEVDRLTKLMGSMEGVAYGLVGTAADEEYEIVNDNVETLMDELQNFAPPYCYFGSHEGDGADFGFWINWDSLEDAFHTGELLKVEAGQEWPEDEIREQREAGTPLEYMLEVNERGNCTLYDLDHNEVWSVV